MIVRPVGWSCNALFITQLKGLDTTDNLIHIPTNTRGVVETKHKLILRIDDEDGSDRKWKLLFVQVTRVNHAVGYGNGTILITNDWELDINFILAMSNDIF